MDENLDFVKVAKIKVIGVGGGGNNAVNRMVTDGVKGVDFYVANTDAQVLKGITGVNKIFLGRDITQGLGAGGNPEILLQQEDYLHCSRVVHGHAHRDPRA